MPFLHTCAASGRKLLRTSFFLLLALTTHTALGQSLVGPFTHPPRSVRSRDFDQQHLKLDLRLDFEKQTADGRAELTLTPYTDLAEIALDAADMQIRGVWLRPGEAAAEVVSTSDSAAQDAAPVRLIDTKNAPEKTSTRPDKKSSVSYSVRGGQLTVRPKKPCPAGRPVILTIDYRIDRPEHGMHFVVPDAREPGQARMAWTQGEPEYARYWFPCVDTPSDRLTSEISATVPADFFVLSNGRLQSQQKNSDGTCTFHWSQARSHVPYLLSLVAGQFDAYEQSWRGVPVVSYVPRGRLADAARSFEKTPAMVEFFSRKIGYAYPWEKYTQICVDEYGWGGMEHTSCTTLNLNTLHDERAHLDVDSDNLVAHELAHQWWGDLCTCKDWAEIWLNESFATYFATLWCEEDLGAEEAAWQRRGEAESYFQEDAKRYRRPIVSYQYDRPMVMFDRHSYPKGARVLHMLRFVLGDDAFWRGIRLYAQRNQYRTVETADLRSAMEEATGQSLTWFFDQWIYHGGHPEYAVTWDWDADAKSVRLNVRQTQKIDERTPLFQMPIEIDLTAADGTVTTRRVTLRKADETFYFERPAPPRRVTFDPRDWVLKKLDFTKSKQEWLDQLAHDPNLICRVEAIAGLKSRTKDVDVAAALCKAAESDSFWAVREQAAEALGGFTGDDVRGALLKIARADDKSPVRRAAIKSLGKFPHDDTRRVLREAIAHDKSYFAVADALRSLVKVDRKSCADDLKQALDLASHQDVILKAACDGLAQLEETTVRGRLVDLLNESPDPSQRVAVMDAVARLGGGDPAVTAALERELNDDRLFVRSAAVKALGKTGDPAAVDLLSARRAKENRQGTIEEIDEAIAALETHGRSLTDLKKQLRDLREQNRRLEERLKRLEEAAGQ